MKLRLYPGALVCVLCLSLARTSFAAELLTFQGQFAPTKVDENVAAEKSFSLQVVVAGEQTAWTLSEAGRGAWPWTERFGLSPQLPALLYDRGDGFSTVPLPESHLRAERMLALDTQWQQSGLTYRVVGEQRAAQTDCWQVTASDNYGPRRSLKVAKGDGLVVELDERVVIGQGEDCALAWSLTKREELDAKVADELLRGFEALAALRGKLAIKPQTRELKWNAEQQQLLHDELAPLTKQISAGPLVAVLLAAKKDTDTQDSRGAALAALQKQALGKTPTKFVLTGTGGEKLSLADLAGEVTVLHFWDYRDAPLEEPYGQVGFLDFLARQKAKSGAKVYGVMVDERLDEAGSRSGAAASARKVKAFMNLSYPVLLDDAGLLKQLGDPRSTGAKLPLWIVIGKDGKVAHYHVGFYDVQRDAGLADLDAAMGAAAK